MKTASGIPASSAWRGRFDVILIMAVTALLSFPNQVRSQVTNEITLPFYNSADFMPEWITSPNQNYANIHQVAGFSLTNQTGTVISEHEVQGHICVANFFFTTCPGICLQMTKNLKRVQEAFSQDPKVLLLSHSVPPNLDTPRILKRYATKQGIRTGKWHLLTGPKRDIYELAAKSYFAEIQSGDSRESNEFIHSENVLLLDGRRRIRGVYNGTLPLDINRLIEDIRILEAERNVAKTK